MASRCHSATSPIICRGKQEEANDKMCVILSCKFHALRTWARHQKVCTKCQYLHDEVIFWYCTFLWTPVLTASLIIYVAKTVVLYHLKNHSALLVAKSYSDLFGFGLAWYMDPDNGGLLKKLWKSTILWF